MAANLNTFSVLLLNDFDKVLVLRNEHQKRKSYIGGWITQDVDRGHTKEEAMNAALAKLVQETNNGSGRDAVAEFFRTHNIQFMDHFVYQLGKWDHIVFVARYLPGDVPLIGNTATEFCYETCDHEWRDLMDTSNLKSCSRSDNQRLLARGIPLF